MLPYGVCYKWERHLYLKLRESMGVGPWIHVMDPKLLWIKPTQLLWPRLITTVFRWMCKRLRWFRLWGMSGNVGEVYQPTMDPYGPIFCVVGLHLIIDEGTSGIGRSWLVALLWGYNHRYPRQWTCMGRATRDGPAHKIKACDARHCSTYTARHQRRYPKDGARSLRICQILDFL
jgi:hypothetical protein